jgi:hypothetical protein
MEGQPVVTSYPGLVDNTKGGLTQLSLYLGGGRGRGGRGRGEGEGGGSLLSLWGEGWRTPAYCSRWETAAYQLGFDKG